MTTSCHEAGLSAATGVHAVTFIGSHGRANASEGVVGSNSKPNSPGKMLESKLLSGRTSCCCASMAVSRDGKGS